MTDFDIQNTRAMDMRPQPPDAYASIGRLGNTKMELLPVFSGDAFRQAVNYAIIVEGWEKAKAGRVRKAYHAEFTQAERNTLARYHGRFYRWHLVSGTPKRVACRIGTLALLKRAVHFFATV